MAKRMAERFDDGDYFAEPNYDQLTDEELDELYNFGHFRSAPKRKKASRKVLKKASPILFADDDNAWLDMDLDGDEDLFEDD